jgi:hypothetical protein
MSQKPKEKKEGSAKEPLEWRRFKALARKVMKAPPMPRELRKVRSLKATSKADAGEAC